jgi:glycosyltransferase involved in cell wall biosynthesis
MELQGPLSNGLVNYISKNKDNYDHFIFVQYLYGPTFFGMPLVWEKSILWPCAHDEPPIYLNIMTDYFKNTKAIITNATEELDLIRRLFNNENVPSLIVGVGINVPEKDKIDSIKVKNKYGLKTPYILYMGRIEAGKGCHDLFEYFSRFKERNNLKLDLVLVGKAIMDIPKRNDIKYLGFVSEEEKFSLIEGCEFLVNPSQFESFSMILMESWLLRKPVLVNGKCEVLKGQCKKSNGGLWYESYEEFEAMLQWMFNSEKIRKEMGKNGKKYVEANYLWDKIEKKLLGFVK